jgi:hypothetical protein
MHPTERPPACGAGATFFPRTRTAVPVRQTVLVDRLCVPLLVARYAPVRIGAMMRAHPVAGRSITQMMRPRSGLALVACCALASCATVPTD